jgi:hypothetical protein
VARAFIVEVLGGDDLLRAQIPDALKSDLGVVEVSLGRLRIRFRLEDGLTLRRYFGFVARNGRFKPMGLQGCYQLPRVHAVAFPNEQSRDPLAVVESELHLANVHIAVEHQPAFGAGAVAGEPKPDQSGHDRDPEHADKNANPISLHSFQSICNRRRRSALAFREVSTSPGLASRSNIGRACFSPSPGLVEPEVPFRNKAVFIPKTYEPKMAAGNGHMGDFAGLEVR